MKTTPKPAIRDDATLPNRGVGSGLPAAPIRKVLPTIPTGISVASDPEIPIQTPAGIGCTDPKLDAYGISFHGAPGEAWKLIKQTGDRLVPTSPRRGFRQALKILDGGLREIGSIHYGGSHGTRVNMEILGPRAQFFADQVRAKMHHTCPRLDSCIDLRGEGVWDLVVVKAGEIKHKYKALHGERRGDWDKPEKGLTLTLGSPEGSAYVRIYQRGKHPDYVHLGQPDLVRMEIQVRPHGLPAKNRFATCSALDAWGASNWSKALLLAVVGESVVRIQPNPAWKQTDDDRVFRWMLKQYGRRLDAAAKAWGGWAQLGVALGETLREIRAHN